MPPKREEPSQERVLLPHLEFQDRAAVVEQLLYGLADPLGDHPPRLGEREAHADRGRRVVRQLPRRAPHVVLHGEACRHLEARVLSRQQLGLAHPVHAEDAYRVPVARPGDRVPATGVEEEAVRLDDADLVRVAADGEVPAADGVPLAQGLLEHLERFRALAGQRPGEHSLDRAEGQREVEFQFAAGRRCRAREREAREAAEATGRAVEQREVPLRQRDACEAPVGPARRLRRTKLEVRQVERALREAVARGGLVTRLPRQLDRLDLDAERPQLVLVALELPAHRLGGRLGLAERRPVVGDVLEDVLAGHREAVLQQVGDQIEPAGGLGLRHWPSAPVRQSRGHHRRRTT